MPKQKTKKAAAKRFKVTGTGKVRFKRAGTGHLLTSKSAKRRRSLRGNGVLCKVEATRIRPMLG